MHTGSGSIYEDFETDAELVCHHLLQTVRQVKSHSQVIDRFRLLFIDGIGEPEIQAALHRLVVSPCSNQRFLGVLNRCCYILINNWMHAPGGDAAIAQLVKLIRQPPIPNDTIPVQRLQDFVEHFSHSPQYKALELRVLAASEPQQTARDRPLRDFISHFPFLYPYYLLEFDTSDRGRATIKKQQQDREAQIEAKLKTFAQFYLSPTQSQRMQQSNASAPENPMLIEAAEVKSAIRQFTSEAIGALAYHEAAMQMVRRSQQAATFREFKADLHAELMLFINQAHRLYHPHNSQNFGDRFLSNWLAAKLNAILPQFDDCRPHIGLRVQTCARLLDVLLDLPNGNSRDHYIFANLTDNIGSMYTIGLLLKIVLICHNGKPAIDKNLDVMKLHLAKCFARLFKHYETNIRDGVDWLVECLENWMIAASIHFGKSGVSAWIAMLNPD